MWPMMRGKLPIKVDLEMKDMANMKIEPQTWTLTAFHTFKARRKIKHKN